MYNILTTKLQQSKKFLLWSLYIFMIMPWFCVNSFHYTTNCLVILSTTTFFWQSYNIVLILFFSSITFQWQSYNYVVIFLFNYNKNHRDTLLRTIKHACLILRSWHHNKVITLSWQCYGCNKMYCHIVITLSSKC